MRRRKDEEGRRSESRKDEDGRRSESADESAVVAVVGGYAGIGGAKDGRGAGEQGRAEGNRR